MEMLGGLIPNSQKKRTHSHPQFWSQLVITSICQLFRNSPRHVFTISWSSTDRTCGYTRYPAQVLILCLSYNLIFFQIRFYSLMLIETNLYARIIKIGAIEKKKLSLQEINPQQKIKLPRGKESTHSFYYVMSSVKQNKIKNRYQGFW